MASGFVYWRRHWHGLGFDRADTRPAQAASLNHNPWAALRTRPRATRGCKVCAQLGTLQLRHQLAHSDQANSCDQTILDRCEAAVCAQKALEFGKHGCPLTGGSAGRGINGSSRLKLPYPRPARALGGRKELFDVDHTQTSQNSAFDRSKPGLISPNLYQHRKHAKPISCPCSGWH